MSEVRVVQVHHILDYTVVVLIDLNWNFQDIYLVAAGVEGKI